MAEGAVAGAVTEEGAPGEPVERLDGVSTVFRVGKTALRGKQFPPFRGKCMKRCFDIK